MHFGRFFGTLKNDLCTFVIQDKSLVIIEYLKMLIKSLALTGF